MGAKFFLNMAGSGKNMNFEPHHTPHTTRYYTTTTTTNMFSARGPLAFVQDPRRRTFGIYIPLMRPEEMVLARFIHETGCVIYSRDQFRQSCLDLGYGTMLWFDDIACGDDCMRWISEYANETLESWRYCALLYVYLSFYMRETMTESLPQWLKDWLYSERLATLAGLDLENLLAHVNVIKEHKHLLFQ